MPRNWRFTPHDAGVIGRLTRELKCSPLLAQVLAARGFSNGTQAREFLRAEMTDLADPHSLPGLSEAAAQIVEALRANRRITIYGDYDVDGVTAVSLLWHCLTRAGGRVDYYIPDRIDEGYGLNCDAIRAFHAEDPDRLVVTVDCGIASHEEAALADRLGLQLIITDHHTPPATLPPAKAIVHPRLTSAPASCADLCGAGVALKLAWGICQRLGDGRKASPQMRSFLTQAVGLAAIGTIADVVPLRAENRILVRFGLAVLPEMPNPGIRALLDVCQIGNQGPLTSDEIAFSLAPRLNAAGRLGQARLAVELLTTGNPERARQLAEYVDQLNKQRQSVERRIFREAKALFAESHDWAHHRAIVLAHEDWHPGVIGIVASRIAEHFERPTALIALNSQDGTGQGSARTFGDFDLYSALSACAGHLETYGGHRAAAGLRIRTDRIDGFRSAFVEHARQVLPAEASGPDLLIDAEVSLADVTHRGVLDLDRLGPFGCDNRRPVFVASGVELVEPPQTMGGGDRHLSLRLRQAGKVLRAVAFGKADWATSIAATSGPLSICFAPTINRFRGYEKVELHLIDWQPQGTS